MLSLMDACFPTYKCIKWNQHHIHVFSYNIHITTHSSYVFSFLGNRAVTESSNALPKIHLNSCAIFCFKKYKLVNYSKFSISTSVPAWSRTVSNFLSHWPGGPCLPCPALPTPHIINFNWFRPSLAQPATQPGSQTQLSLQLQSSQREPGGSQDYNSM